MTSEETLPSPKVAFLGPLGTYSHQCAVEHFGDNATYTNYPTLTKVFHAVGDEVDYALIPQENTIFGSVVETYDCLRLPELGENKFIRGEKTIGIQHCLVVRQGVELGDVKKIISHEQALGQCSKFLTENFPDAILEKRPSTAEAAQSLLTPEEGFEGERAAICSAVCATMFEELQLVRKVFKTRNPRLRQALIRIGMTAEAEIPPENASYHRPLHHVISTLFTSFGVPVTRIDRRPSLRPIPFDDVYFIEVEELGTPLEYRNPTASPSSVSEENWLRKVQESVRRVRSAGLDATLIGLW
ncbi:hypothetical protein QCA50_002007 [Cerrena zonata]|uniref:prephenate dehydratase n=1 Tax=Cerrena zonata TaxID=2478898 RepID=A0AAW0GUN0_9APHY